VCLCTQSLYHFQDVICCRPSSISAGTIENCLANSCIQSTLPLSSWPYIAKSACGTACVDKGVK
jgi:hypothetical protein